MHKLLLTLHRFHAGLESPRNSKIFCSIFQDCIVLKNVVILSLVLENECRKFVRLIILEYK